MGQVPDDENLTHGWSLRYQTRELRKKESESLEKRPVSVVISKDGEEPLSQKEL